MSTTPEASTSAATKPKKAAAPKTAAAAAAIQDGRRLKMHLPDDVAAAAALLKDFVKVQKLSSQVQGKDFVNVEGWQYAGSLFGWHAKAEHAINLSNEQEMKYQAKAVVVNHKGVEVGAGFAICSNKESGKKFYQEFAIASMAQTRAVGKAFRNGLAFLMRLAGYEATPAEEMDWDTNKTQNVQQQPVQAQLPGKPEAPVMRAVTVTENQAAFTGSDQSTKRVPVQYATASQKEEIIRLLNHPLITIQEKTKMLLNINKLDEARATQAIAKLRKAIEDREGTTAVAE